MKYLTFFLVFCCYFCSNGQTNETFWVFFKDKKDVSFDPYAYFDAKAIERRINQNIPIDDSTDYPINPTYLKRIKNNVDSITGQSRWLNAVYVHGTSEQLASVSKYPFVSHIEKRTHLESHLAEAKLEDIESSFELNEIEVQLLIDQVEQLGGEAFRSANIDGSGIRVAILDAGFPGVDVHPAFEHIRKENRIIKTYDFVKKRDFVYKFSSHGTSVMSCIGGKYGDKWIGLAPKAEFLLARTEKSNSEPFAEEKYWLAAVEWADKNGAQVINSSLAYTYHRYFTTEMDGKSSLVSEAARIAARKGMLVVNAAGNDGDNSWKIIATPSDVDSVLTVGGINPYTGYHMDFSSFGPTADRKMKPNVCAFAQVIAADKEGMKETYGTSFASPLIAGFAACVWQYLDKTNNMAVFKEIEKAAHLYPYFDYAHGFGVPKAERILGNNEVSEQSFEVQQDKFSVRVLVDEFFGDSSTQEELDVSDEFNSSDSSGVIIQPDAMFQMQIEKLNKAFLDDEYLYYNIQDKNGFISYYSVVEVSNYEALKLDRDIFENGYKLNIHYRGFTKTLTFE